MAERALDLVPLRNLVAEPQAVQPADDRCRHGVGQRFEVQKRSERDRQHAEWPQRVREDWGALGRRARGAGAVEEARAVIVMLQHLVLCHLEAAAEEVGKAAVHARHPRVVALRRLEPLPRLDPAVESRAFGAEERGGDGAKAACLDEVVGVALPPTLRRREACAQSLSERLITTNSRAEEEKAQVERPLLITSSSSTEEEKGQE